MDRISDDLCTFCKSTTKKYTCPQCQADYCSITCFQSTAHIECAESFYKSCVLENLPTGPHDDEEARQKLNEMFQRLRDCDEEDPLDSDDDEECESLATRLKNVDLDDTKEVWKRLTGDERQEFEAFLKSGDVSKLVPRWTPWWCPAKIQEVGELQKQSAPPLLENIAKFSSLTSKPPAETVRYNLVNIVCAYVFTARYFNGDYYEFLGEAVGCVVYLSLCLKENKNYSGFEEAVDSVQEECLKNDWITVDHENMETMKSDVNVILKGRATDKNCFTLSALSDLHRLIAALMKEKQGTGNTFLQNCPKYKLPKRDLKLYLKKLEYLLSYTMYFDKTTAP
uniref:HIT-type domain-containing protein n=1 Tax=Photinus pyralis TaxID=7054 RepID=A0A1Y1LQ69_PHOPY